MKCRLAVVACAGLLLGCRQGQTTFDPFLGRPTIPPPSMNQIDDAADPYAEPDGTPPGRPGVSPSNQRLGGLSGARTSQLPRDRRLNSRWKNLGATSSADRPVFDVDSGGESAPAAEFADGAYVGSEVVAAGYEAEIRDVPREDPRVSAREPRRFSPGGEVRRMPADAPPDPFDPMEGGTADPRTRASFAGTRQFANRNRPNPGAAPSEPALETDAEASGFTNSNEATESEEPSGAPSRTARYAFDPDYRWLSGQLEYSQSERQWKLRYIPFDGSEGEMDEYGGSVNLAPSPDLEGLEPGDFVTVQGSVTGRARPGSGYSPQYSIRSLRRRS